MFIHRVTSQRIGYFHVVTPCLSQRVILKGLFQSGSCQQQTDLITDFLQQQPVYNRICQKLPAYTLSWKLHSDYRVPDSGLGLNSRLESVFTGLGDWPGMDPESQLVRKRLQLNSAQGSIPAASTKNFTLMLLDSSLSLIHNATWSQLSYRLGQLRN